MNMRKLLFGIAGGAALAGAAARADGGTNAVNRRYEQASPLSIRQENGTSTGERYIVLSWDGDGILQAARNLGDEGGEWSDVEGAASPYKVVVNDPANPNPYANRGFYRLRVNPIVDINWRLAPDYSNIHELDGKTKVVPSDYYDTPHGNVFDQNNNPLYNQTVRLFFKDNGGQMVGITPMNYGTSDYYFVSGTAIYGDLDWTPSTDEGIQIHEVPGVLAFFPEAGHWYCANIAGGRLLNEGFVSEGSDVGQNDIRINLGHEVGTRTDALKLRDANILPSSPNIHYGYPYQ